MKTLRVCHSKDLPSIHDRDINYIYFLYDKLEVFLGQNYYSDPYAIVESYPFDNVIPGMLYFCLDDGYVKAQVNLVDTKIAKIESDEQLEILKQAGTTFFVNAERRYLDVRTRCISLPFRNGSYELTVNLAADLKINKNTVIAFNPETQQFEIVGDIQDFDIVFSRDYRGLKTDSVDTKVEDHKISSDVILLYICLALLDFCDKLRHYFIDITNDGIMCNIKYRCIFIGIYRNNAVRRLHTRRKLHSA